MTVRPAPTVLRPALTALAALAALALRTRGSVAPRQRHWEQQARTGDLLWIALGDSLTQGTGSSSPGTSWLGRSVDAAATRTGRTVRVVNLARYGARVADVLAVQLPAAQDLAVGLAEADVVSVCVGSNDAGRRSAAAFRSDLEQLCDALPDGAIIGDVPEFQWGPRVAAAALLSAAVREVVAARPHLILAPVERATTGTRISTELAGDFFHPNDSGHARIASAFTPPVLDRLARDRIS